jgi:transposase
MLQALVAGTTDPIVLADLARGKLRKKLPALRHALLGHFRAHHAFLVSQLLAHLDYLDEAIETVSTQIDGAMAPFAEQLARLDTIRGVNKRTAEVLIAELGPDMSVFPTAKHAASWAGHCPGNHESAGKHRSGRTRQPLAPRRPDRGRPRRQRPLHHRRLRRARSPGPAPGAQETDHSALRLHITSSVVFGG